MQHCTLHLPEFSGNLENSLEGNLDGENPVILDESIVDGDAFEVGSAGRGDGDRHLQRTAVAITLGPWSQLLVHVIEGLSLGLYTRAFSIWYLWRLNHPNALGLVQIIALVWTIPASRSTEMSFTQSPIKNMITLPCRQGIPGCGTCPAGYAAHPSRSRGQCQGLAGHR